MFIADIAFERPDAPKEKRWVRFGSLWVKGEQRRLKLTGVHIGGYAARLKPDLLPEYVAGDLFVSLGSLIGPGKFEEQWIGHIQTADEDGVVYFGEILVMPVKIGVQELWVTIRE